jgi:hypothetical protein
MHPAAMAYEPLPGSAIFDATNPQQLQPAGQHRVMDASLYSRSVLFTPLRPMLTSLQEKESTRLDSSTQGSDMSLLEQKVEEFRTLVGAEVRLWLFIRLSSC